MSSDPVPRVPDKAMSRKRTPRKRTRSEAFLSRFPNRYRDYLDGTLPISELDIEELRRGQLRDINGNFTGTPPSIMPMSFYHELQAEYLRRVKQDNLIAVEEAYAALRDVLDNFRSPADARVKAAKELLDRLEGTAQQNLNITGSVEVKAKWESLLESGEIVVDVDDETKQIENVQDAEVEDDL